MKFVRGAAILLAALQTPVVLQVIFRDLYVERYGRALLLGLLLVAGWAVLRPTLGLVSWLLVCNSVYLFL